MVPTKEAVYFLQAEMTQLISCNKPAKIHRALAEPKARRTKAQYSIDDERPKIKKIAYLIIEVRRFFQNNADGKAVHIPMFRLKRIARHDWLSGS